MEVHPLVGERESAGLDAEPVFAPLHAALNQPGLLQHLHVLRHAVQTHAEGLSQIADPQFSGLPQELDNLAPRAVRKGLKHAIQRFLRLAFL